MGELAELRGGEGERKAAGQLFVKKFFQRCRQGRYLDSFSPQAANPCVWTVWQANVNSGDVRLWSFITADTRYTDLFNSVLTEHQSWVTGQVQFQVLNHWLNVLAAASTDKTIAAIGSIPARMWVPEVTR